MRPSIQHAIARAQEMQIELATPDDYTAVRAALIVACAELQFVMPAPAFSAYLVDLLDLEGRADFSTLLVARRRGRVIGTASHYRDGVGQQSGWPPGWSAVGSLAVVPQARRRGIATGLMAECLNRALADRAPVLALHAPTASPGAAPFCQHLGFLRTPEWDRNLPEPGRGASISGGVPAHAYALTLG